MKKLIFLLSIFLLTACTPGEFSPSVDAAAHADEEAAACGPGTAYETTCRIVDGADSGNLLLAEWDGSGIYTLNLSDAAKWKLDTPLQNGQLLTILHQGTLETWPGRFHAISQILLPEYGFDDRCTLYLRVLEDLREKDSGLNGGVEVIGVDLSQTSLSLSEQSAVAWAFAERHGAEAVIGSIDDLAEQGYISAEPISATGSGTDLTDPAYFFYHWENGCHYSITEKPMEGQYSLVPVTFDACKWRSSLGAYFFADCTAVRSALGTWSDYTIGSEMIS